MYLMYILYIFIYIYIVETFVDAKDEFARGTDPGALDPLPRLSPP